jgi:glycine/D-amino acid oxidase-like deaminating enzyme
MPEAIRRDRAHGTAVKKITVENGRVSAVITEDGTRYDADAVVASGGAVSSFTN